MNASQERHEVRVCELLLVPTHSEKVVRARNFPSRKHAGDWLTRRKEFTRRVCERLCTSEAPVHE